MICDNKDIVVSIKNILIHLYILCSKKILKLLRMTFLFKDTGVPVFLPCDQLC